MRNQKGFSLVEVMVAAVILLIFGFGLAKVAGAADLVGTAQSKGLMFKDTIKVFAFNDPDIKGLACYTTRYSRSLSFVDSTNSSLACRQIGPVDMTMKMPKVTRGLFSQQKGFIFSKSTVVDRFIDYKRKVVVYLSYTKGSVGDRNSSHSISVVALK